MPVVLITGAAGLIGSEAALFFASKGFDIIGVDNDLRRYFFGTEGSTSWRRQMLERDLRGYRHVDADIRDEGAMDRLFARHAGSIALVIHTAAQPSHDWAAREPLTDFTVNANDTRAGDHIWWVSDIRKFASHYPDWALTYTLERTIEEIHHEMSERAADSQGR